MSWIVYIIPGFDPSADAHGYRAVASEFKAIGARVTIINISWKYQTVTSYTRKVLEHIVKNSTTNSICLFGFSMGAVVALLIAPRLNVNCLVLCSMSPYFKENLSRISADDQASLGLRRIRDFRQYRFKTIASQISCRALIVTGDQESKSVIKMSTKASREIKKAELIPIPNGIHSLSQPEYVRKLEEVIRKKIGRRR